MVVCYGACGQWRFIFKKCAGFQNSARLKLAIVTECSLLVCFELTCKGEGGEVQYVVFVLNTWKCVLTRQCWKITTKVCCLCNLEMDDRLLSGSIRRSIVKVVTGRIPINFPYLPFKLLCYSDKTLSYLVAINKNVPIFRTHQKTHWYSCI